MKVLFINPTVKKETQHPLFTSIVFSSPPLGLAYVVGYLRKKTKLEIKVIDEVATPLAGNDLINVIVNIKEPLVVGFSCLTATYARAVELAMEIKRIKPESFIVFGGVHPTALPHESLETGIVDAVIRGEGEITMFELSDSLQKEKCLDSVKGISYISGGVIHDNPGRGYTSLDTLPRFPYDLFDKNIKKYSDFGFLITSRGCPFDCTFCSNRIVTQRVYRTFNTIYVIEQLETLIRKYNQKNIFFGDDNLIVNKKRFFDLTNAILEKGLHEQASFTAQFRAEDMAEEVLEQMKKANFKMLSCGVETSSERLMALINKNQKIADVKKGIELASSKGFLTSTTFIYGLPTETRLERRNSARLSRTLPLDSVRFNIAIPYPGTKLFETAQKENRLHIAPEWKNFNVQYYLFGDDIPYIPTSTGRYALIFDTMWANIRFYLRFKILLKTVLNMNITGGGVVSLQNRKDTFKLYLELFRIAFFMIRRFIYVGVNALQEKFYSKSGGE
jgi:anaerobic magnesium-protoporphyrin IX monomethyl ester cyclase